MRYMFVGGTRSYISSKIEDLHEILSKKIMMLHLANILGSFELSSS